MVTVPLAAVSSNLTGEPSVYFDGLPKLDQFVVEVSQSVVFAAVHSSGVPGGAGLAPAMTAAI